MFSSPHSPRRPGGTRTNTLAIVSLVAGLICCIPFVSPGLAIGCGVGSLKQIDTNPSVEQGRGLAIAGIVFGALTAVLQMFWLIGIMSRRM